MKKIYIIHENSEWTGFLTNRLEQLGQPYEEWHLDQGNFDLSTIPPEGIFYNRMSASSHTRDHRFAPEYTAAVLAWLEKHNRKVLNSSRALQLEVSKVAQYVALQSQGIVTPKTIVAVGKKHILAAAKQFDEQPFITKHNRAGKGLGVHLFYSIEALKEYLESPMFEEPVDGITLLQQYIEAPEPYIIRCEFIGGKFVYAVRVDTSEGFQLCPADACQIGDAFCPIGEESPKKPKFEILKQFNDPIIAKYEQTLLTNNIDVAGIEFIYDKNGQIYTYDINTNTNYNADAEQKAGIFGMLELAKYLASELKKI